MPSPLQTGTAARPIGTTAIVASVIVLLVNATTSNRPDWVNALAIVLAVIGAGLRIEAAIKDKG
jgi:protein-S-isoprenylcysteine O-methyltransferase Ste14